MFVLRCCRSLLIFLYLAVQLSFFRQTFFRPMNLFSVCFKNLNRMGIVIELRQETKKTGWSPIMMVHPRFCFFKLLVNKVILVVLHETSEHIDQPWGDLIATIQTKVKNLEKMTNFEISSNLTIGKFSLDPFFLN